MRKIISIIIALAISSLFIVNGYKVIMHDNDTVRETGQCFQLTVEDKAKPRAVVYYPSDSHTSVIDGTCEEHAIHQSFKRNWDEVNKFTVATGLFGLLVGFVFGVSIGLFIIAMVIIIPIVALYRWGWCSYYEDQSYWKILMNMWSDLIH